MKYSPELAEANTILCLEIFHSEAERISLPPHVSDHKQLLHCPLVFICLMAWLARMKTQEDIIVPADTSDVGIIDEMDLNKSADPKGVGIPMYCTEKKWPSIYDGIGMVPLKRNGISPGPIESMTATCRRNIAVIVSIRGLKCWRRGAQRRQILAQETAPRNTGERESVAGSSTGHSRRRSRLPVFSRLPESALRCDSVSDAGAYTITRHSPTKHGPPCASRRHGTVGSGQKKIVQTTCNIG